MNIIIKFNVNINNNYKIIIKFWNLLCYTLKCDVSGQIILINIIKYFSKLMLIIVVILILNLIIMAIVLFKIFF
jgi:hypothetical protein